MTMPIIEASGSWRAIGCATGEALRHAIRARLELFPGLLPDRSPGFRRSYPAVLDVMRTHLPHLVEEMEGTAAGADLPFETIVALNWPVYNRDLDFDEACTNIVFAGGADGPVWGKNNDGSSATLQQPVCCRLIRPPTGLPMVSFTFCGTLGFGDGMNVAGLALGHSSVGSVFQQSDAYVPVRLWAHQGMLTCRTTAQFARHMASRPLRGKGYSWAVVDCAGVACSLEVACPLVQVRRSAHPAGHLHCLNLYQLPALCTADRRKPAAKELALARWAMLDRELAATGADAGLKEMTALLRSHGPPGICRHGGDDGSFTEYSMIGLPASGRVLFAHGQPCGQAYGEVRI